jgi:hypothetical protein
MMRSKHRHAQQDYVPRYQNVRMTYTKYICADAHHVRAHGLTRAHIQPASVQINNVRANEINTRAPRKGPRHPPSSPQTLNLETRYVAEQAVSTDLAVHPQLPSLHCAFLPLLRATFWASVCSQRVRGSVRVLCPALRAAHVCTCVCMRRNRLLNVRIHVTNLSFV